MIEVRVFSTLRQGREKVRMPEPEGLNTAGDVLKFMDIPAGDVAILLINGFHSKPEDRIKDGDILTLFPPVAGG